MKNNVIEPAIVKGAGTEIQEGDITMSVYTFRKLGAPDMFLMFRIFGKIGINEFAECFGKDAVQKMFTALSTDGGMSNFTTMMGISVTLEIVNVVLGNLPKCEQEIYQLLSSTSNLTVKQVKELDFPTFTAMVLDFIKKDEFKDFIKVVSASFK